MFKKDTEKLVEKEEKKIYKQFAEVAEKAIEAQGHEIAPVNIELLEELGMDKASASYRKAIADAKYAYLSQEKMSEIKAWFDDRYKLLGLIVQKIADYPGIPPADILQKAVDIKKESLFDDFGIAYVGISQEKEAKLRDPFLLGTISGHQGYWILAEWGDDVELIRKAMGDVKRKDK